MGKGWDAAALCSTGLNEPAAAAEKDGAAASAGPVISTGSFLAAGIPATTLGTYDTAWWIMISRTGG
jgi:hypothetical protein